MAYIINRDEEELQQGTSAPTATPPPASVGGTAPASPFAALAPEQKKAQGAHGSGHFYDFSRLLNANHGRGEALAGQMVQGVNDKIGKATGEVNKTVDTFNAAATGPQGTLKTFDPMDAQGNINGELFQQAGERRAEQYRDMHYAGPRSLENTQGAQDAIRDAQQRAQVLSSNRGALLDGTAGYNRGQRAFDVLVSGAGGKQQFDATRKNANVLNKLFADANAGAATRVADIDSQYGAFNAAGNSYYGNRDAAQTEWDKRRADYEHSLRPQFENSRFVQGLATADKDAMWDNFLHMTPEEQAWNLQTNFGADRNDDSPEMPAAAGEWGASQPYVYDPYNYFNR